LPFFINLAKKPIINYFSSNKQFFPIISSRKSLRKKMVFFKLCLFFLVLSLVDSMPINVTGSVYEANERYLELELGCSGVECLCGENFNFTCAKDEFCTPPKGYSEPRR